jgi:putative transposase
VFDKGYCHYGWWTSIDQAKALFVTRPKTNMGLEWLAEYQGPHPRGDGFVIVEDSWVHLSSKGHSKLPIPLRRIRLKRDNGQVITLITNDLIRSAVGIAALYKARWQIELLFRWIKQNLRITSSSATTTMPSACSSMPQWSLMRWCASPPQPIASPSRSCASSNSSDAICSNDDKWPPSKSRQPSIPTRRN